MKDKDTQLIWEAYGSDDRVSTGIGQGGWPTDRTSGRPEVGSLSSNYEDLGSAVWSDQLQDIIDDLVATHPEPYEPGTIKMTAEFKRSLQQHLKQTAREAESSRDPEDYKEVDERVVAAELDNYIGWLFGIGDKQPYSAIKQYLYSEFGDLTEPEEEPDYDTEPDYRRGGGGDYI